MSDFLQENRRTLIQFLGLLVLLVPCAVTDLRKRVVPVYYTLVFAAAAAVLNLFTGDVAWYDMLAGALTGGLFLLFSRITRGALGAGDGFVIGAMGVLAGTMKTISVTFAALVLAALTGLVSELVRSGKVDMRKALPLVPFLAASAVLVSTLELLPWSHV